MSLLKTDEQARLSAASAASDRVLAQTARSGAESALAGAQVARDQSQAAAILTQDYGGAKPYRDWAALDDVTGADGDMAIILTGDGAHTDPVVGGTVPDQGIYAWVASPAGWERVGDTSAVQAATQVALAAEEADRAELFAQALLNIVPGVIYTPDNGGIAQALIDTADGESFVFVDNPGDPDTARSYIYRNDAGSEVLLFEDATQAGVLARLGQTTGAESIGTADGNTVQDVVFRKVDLPAVLGSQMGIGYRMSYNGADARYLGGMWPATNYCAWLFEAKFTAANTPGVGESPASTAFFYAENDGSGKDVVAGMFVTYLKTATGAGFSTNHIVTGDIGLIGAKYVCSEFDIQPAAGATVDANSIGIPVNAFNAPIPTCFQIGGVGGGDFGNVLVAYTGTGAVLAGGAGATMGSLFNTGAATYTTAAGVFSNEHRLQFSGTAGSHFTMRCDSSNNFRVKFGGGAFIFRDPSDISSVAVIGQDGSAAFGANASVSAGYKVDAAADIGGDGIGLFRGSTSTGVVSVELQTATGATGNAAGATARFRANGTTGRAVNAGGTINASGADYAEYEWLAPGVSGFRKGDVVGFNADGLLTDRFADAVRFAVKSTNPNLVGGDDWESMVPASPERPVFQPPEYTGTRDPGPTWPKAEYPAGYTALRQDFVEKVRASQEAKKGSARARRLQNEIADIQQQLEVMRFEKDASDTALHAQWEADKERYQTESAAHEAAVEAAHATWKATVLADWYDAVIALENQREALRARVERIAYCGKVPVNAPTGKSGDYLIPCDDGKGGITARVVARADLTDADSLIRLGSINRTLADGRPEVVVHVG